MSKVSYHLGIRIASDLIDKADRRHANGSGWDTDDLADFVAGLIDTAMLEYMRLHPEQVEHIDIHVHEH